MQLDYLTSMMVPRRPWGQLFWANTALAATYRLPRRVEILIEGEHLIPNRPVMFAMNHTDRYNSWPFQYHFYRHREEFMAVWVKAKYYQNSFLSFCLRSTLTVPLPSRGYLLLQMFREQFGRPPAPEEYRPL